VILSVAVVVVCLLTILHPLHIRRNHWTFERRLNM